MTKSPRFKETFADGVELSVEVFLLVIPDFDSVLVGETTSNSTEFEAVFVSADDGSEGAGETAFSFDESDGVVGLFIVTFTAVEGGFVGLVPLAKDNALERLRAENEFVPEEFQVGDGDGVGNEESFAGDGGD